MVQGPQVAPSRSARVPRAPRKRARRPHSIALRAQKSGQHVNGIHSDRLDGIAAFHDEERRLPELGYAGAVGSEVIRPELEEADRVLLEGVDTKRYDERIGTEALDPAAGIIERRRPLVVSGSGRHRIVHIEPFALAAALLVLVAEEIREGVFRPS